MLKTEGTFLTMNLMRLPPTVRMRTCRCYLNWIIEIAITGNAQNFRKMRLFDAMYFIYINSLTLDGKKGKGKNKKKNQNANIRATDSKPKNIKSMFAAAAVKPKKAPEVSNLFEFDLNLFGCITLTILWSTVKETNY